MTNLSTLGAVGEAWAILDAAVCADLPYRPARATPKPDTRGVDSAEVVGPAGEEIHTDEFGWVRILFVWDREGKFDDASSCWVRVSQTWACSGYGSMAIPRAGQEVLDGPTLMIEGKGKICVSSHQDDIVMTGSPHVSINPAPPRERKPKVAWDKRLK